ncbi:MAG: hypothetical protein GF392_02195 [Candidatus Omnitrophica bacterium]|nr:hypothetical protein [Candidatus Omnitrophota bacterium]
MLKKDHICIITRIRSILLSAVMFCISVNAFAQIRAEERLFFSYDRFYEKAAIVEDEIGDGRIRSDMISFMRNFSEGLFSVSAGRLREARGYFRRARGIWPEYFGTDFLLARVNEDLDEYGLAARYYKSYLNKLTAYSRGSYRISAPLIRAITPYAVENPDLARKLIRERLLEYGINLGNVRPVYTIPAFVWNILVLVLLGLAYVLITRWGLPYIRRKRRVMNPPEGFWVCSHCGTENPELRYECQECRRPRP